MTDSRAFFARPAPGTAAPEFELRGAPAAFDSGLDEAVPTPAATVPLEPTRASRQRRALAVASVGLAVAAVVVGAGAAIALQPQEPSLAVFDREPSSAESEMLALMTDQQSGTFFVGEALEIRRLLTASAGDAGAPQEVWALRTEIDQPGVFTGAVVCLSTAPANPDGAGVLACMEEVDVARRGFIPLDQPRPAIVVDGESRVIQWGPFGDARLIDPPALPSPSASDPSSDPPSDATGSAGR